MPRVKSINLRLQLIFLLGFFSFVFKPISDIINHFLFEFNNLIYLLFFHGQFSPHVPNICLMCLIHIQYHLSFAFFFQYKCFNFIFVILPLIYKSLYFFIISLCPVVSLGLLGLALFLQDIIVR